MISKKIRQKLINEYVAGGRSYRELEAVYGVPVSTLQRWVAASGLEREPVSRPPQRIGRTVSGRKRGILSGSTYGSTSGSEAVTQETPSEEIKRLRRELDEARLYGRLMEAMIEIAEAEFEISIRKKSGAKPRSCWSNSH